MRQIAAFILTIGVHYGESLRQRVAAQVVVKDDDIAGGSCDGIMAERATINAKDQIMRGTEGRHGGHVGPIAFVNPVRDVKRGR